MKQPPIIIGSGIAGLTAALTLAEKTPVLLLTQKNLRDSATRYAQGGLAAVLPQANSRDSLAQHAQDTYLAGSKHSNQNALKFFVRRAPQALQWLTNLGVKFAPEPTREAAHTYPRIWHTQDSTGQTLIQILSQKVQKHPQITILTQAELLDLIVIENTCYGIYYRHNKKIQTCRSNQIILATGGSSALFAHTTNPRTSLGSGLAIAARAQAKFQDLEFIQFHPTALCSQNQQLLLLSESLRGEGALLLNSHGQRFLKNLHPAAELAPRDLVAQAIYQEQQKGPVYLDFRHAPKKFLPKRFPFIFHQIQKIGLNLARDLIPITPAAHYHCGGIKVNLRSATSIKNLWALGEVACTGIHGANRLASNSLTEALVFARELGKKQIPTPPRQKNPQIPRPRKYIFDPQEDRQVLKLVQKILTAKVGIKRTSAGLKEAQTILARLTPKSYHAVNAVTTARLIVTFARKRKKSLGGHCLQIKENLP